MIDKRKEIIQILDNLAEEQKEKNPAVAAILFNTCASLCLNMEDDLRMVVADFIEFVAAQHTPPEFN